MWPKCLLQCIVLVSLSGLVSADAHAQPRLLVELHKQGFQMPVSAGSPVTLEFITEVTDHTTRTIFAGTYTDTDEGMAFEAPADLVERFETALSAPRGQFAITGGGSTPIGVDADSIWNPASGYMPTAHVPRLGHGLTGYNLTRVTRTIDQLDYFIQPGPSGGPTAEIRQTISLYGEPIPEPASIVLLIVAHVLVLSRRFAFHRVRALDR
jgi:hypothetical protein